MPTPDAQRGRARAVLAAWPAVAVDDPLGRVRLPRLEERMGLFFEDDEALETGHRRTSPGRTQADSVALGDIAMLCRRRP